MKTLFLIVTLFFSFKTYAQSRVLKIGIIDTGIVKEQMKTLPICETRDFTDTSIYDTNSHGKYVLDLLVKDLDKTKYCLYIAKVIDVNVDGTSFKTANAINWMVSNKVDIVNISLGGTSFDIVEKIAVERMINSNTIVVAAAGNNGSNLDKICNYYPACYLPTIQVVGNGLSNEFPAKTSNYGGGVVKHWYIGSYAGKTGTSFAAPKHSNLLSRILIASLQYDSKY